MRYLTLLAVAAILANCSTNVAVKPDVPTCKDCLQVPLNKSWPNEAWAKYAYEKVVVLPRTSDEKEFCPQGLTRANWVHLLAAMAYYESGFDPKKTYLEKFLNSRGERIISTGLMQISYEQSRHRDYGYPRVTTEQLKDPFTNLDIAVKIMKRIVSQDGVVANKTGTTWKGGARAWSVLRHSWKLPSVKARLRKYCQ